MPRTRHTGLLAALIALLALAFGSAGPASAAFHTSSAAPRVASNTSDDCDTGASDPDDMKPSGDNDPEDANIDPTDDTLDDAVDVADDMGDDDCEAALDTGGGTRQGGTSNVDLDMTLETGKLSAGGVKTSGPATIKQTLYITKPSGQTRAAIASVSAKKRSAKVKQIVAGTTTKRVSKAGVVNITVTLNSAAKAILKKAKSNVRVTVKTTTKPKKGKAKTTTGYIVLLKIS